MVRTKVGLRAEEISFIVARFGDQIVDEKISKSSSVVIVKKKAEISVKNFQFKSLGQGRVIAFKSKNHVSIEH